MSLSGVVDFIVSQIGYAALFNYHSRMMSQPLRMTMPIFKIVMHEKITGTSKNPLSTVQNDSSGLDKPLNSR